MEKRKECPRERPCRAVGAGRERPLLHGGARDINIPPRWACRRPRMDAYGRDGGGRRRRGVHPRSRGGGVRIWIPTFAAALGNWPHLESAKRPRDGNPAAHESPAEPEVEDAFAHPTAPTRSRARRRWCPGRTRMEPRSLQGRKPGDAGWPRVLVYSLPCSLTHPSASPSQGAPEIFPPTREY